MATITFDPVKFRLQFPEFADSTKYTDVMLDMYFEMATCYVDDEDYGCLSGSCRELALNFMTAHLTKIGTDTTIGDDPAFVSSATVDKVSVTTKPPPEKDQYEWWMSLTSYGQQLLALLKAKSAGGCYIGGAPEQAAFRGVGGYFF